MAHHLSSKHRLAYWGLLAASTGGGFGVNFGATDAFGDGVVAGVPAATLGRVCGVGRASLELAAAPGSTTAFAGGMDSEMAEFAQIWARFSLLISNSITFRLGISGSAGTVICLPLIKSSTTLASEWD
jgi:hypothetical protein